MRQMIVLAFIGFLAQLVDGSLGMAYGVTSTSLLLMYGLPVAVASASIHMAEVVTTAASGISHLKFGNVDKHIVIELILPGSIGAFLGAVFISNLNSEMMKPYVACFLFVLGCYVIIRFLWMKNKENNPPRKQPLKRRFLLPLGMIAGFADASGGGGWGPLTTPVLLSKRIEPRKVIGSVDTSEFAIALSATLGFFLSLGWQKMDYQWVIALMIGGVIAAPIAAWLVKIIPASLLGVLVGGVIIWSNISILLSELTWIPSNWHIFIYLILGLCYLAAFSYALYHLRNKRKITSL